MIANKNKFSSIFSNLAVENISQHQDSHPPKKLDNQGRLVCGNLNIRIDREGIWFYNGSPIRRKELVKLFSSVLQKDNENRFWLITPAEKGEIIVDDAPFTAVELFVSGHGEKQNLEFRTNIDEIVPASSSHPLKFRIDSETGEPSPYILVRKNLDAKLTRSVFYQLVDLGVEKWNLENQIFGVWSNGIFFEIGKLN